MEQPATVPAAIDALLAHGELTGLTRLPRARSEARLAAKAPILVYVNSSSSW